MGDLSGITMPTLRILDSLSDPGNAGRRNEDTTGSNASCAFVIDGATGLGGKPLLDVTSDAAWLAVFAAQAFEAEIGMTNSIADVVRNVNMRVQQRILEAPSGEIVEAWALPTASFQLVRVEGRELAVYGLGDCRLFLAGADGTAFETNGNYSKAESEGARRAVAQAGGLAAWRSLADEPVVREALRRSRACGRWAARPKQPPIFQFDGSAPPCRRAGFYAPTAFQPWSINTRAMRAPG